MPRIVSATAEAIKQSAALIVAGDIVVLPTETVYGLGANALDADAVAKIFKAKNRPNFNPLIIHVADKTQAQGYAEFDGIAHKIADLFWPTALTLILPLKKNSGIAANVTVGLKTIAVRVPNHKIMREVIKQSGVPIAAPSANNSGEPSATTPAHAAQSLGDNAPFILADGACDVGLESTILDLSGDVPTILRAGAVTFEALQAHLPNLQIDNVSKQSADEVKSPGQLLKHYAPSLPVRLNAVDVANGEALLAFGSVKFMSFKSGGHVKDMNKEAYKNLSEDGDLDEAAKNLFMMLRDLDCALHTGIAVMNIPDKGIGVAINERLSRAASQA